MNSRTELNQDKQEKIEQEEKKEQQKKIIKRIVKIIVFLFFVIFLFFFYIVKIGSVRLLVHEEMIANKKIPNHFHGLKIVQISDIHYENKKLLEDAIKQMNIRRPDLVFFTGDLLKEVSISSDDRNQLLQQLKKIEAPLGKYAVLGETDTEEAVSILNDSGFTILNDSYDLIYKDNIDPILLVGINSNQKDPNFEQAFDYFKQEQKIENIFTIVIFHHPDMIDTILSYRKVDVAMAGHSHLGEVKIPKIITFSKKDGAKKYDDSSYDIDGVKFYISSGIGTSEYPYRFFARPSIEFYRLSQKD